MNEIVALLQPLIDAADATAEPAEAFVARVQRRRVRRLRRMRVATLLLVVGTAATPVAVWHLARSTHDNPAERIKASGPDPATAHTSTSKAVTTAPQTATPAGVPVLGRPFMGGCPRCQGGLGEVRPDTINMGGDPTGVVTDVRWRSWGGSQAIGSGIAEWLEPNQIVADGTEEPATIVAFDLGTCKGKRAYTAIAWYFPQHGQHFDPSTHINICTGDYVGTNGAVPPSP